MRAIQYSRDGQVEKLEVGLEPVEIQEDIVNVFLSHPLHSFLGFGCALTPASAEVLKCLDPVQRSAVLRTMFSKEGLDERHLRLCIDSCDFSSCMYSAFISFEALKKGHLDFSNDEVLIFPILDEIMEIREGDLEIMMSPWSPPKEMKTNGRRCKGGRLKDACYEDYARYLSLYVKHYKEKGYPVSFVSVQNEPEACQTWDSCIYTSPDEHRLATLLKEELGEGVGILAFDHNKQDLVQRLEAYPGLDVFSGVAFHDYMGDHFEALQLARQMKPASRLVMSEYCIEKSGKPKDGFHLYLHNFINDISHGADTVIDWNLVLGKDGGPNHVGNYCQAPLMTENGLVVKKPMFHALEALSKDVALPCKVLPTSSFNTGLDVLAMEGADNSVSVIIYPYGRDRHVNLRVGHHVYSFDITPGAACNVRIEGYEL